ncbi:MAG: YraN family protein [bacterium]
MRLITWLTSLWRKKLSSAPRESVGRWGEGKAVHYLRHRGYKILARNWRVRMGEIDIVAAKNREVVFVEVKSGSKSSAMGPELRVGTHKQRKLRALAQAYLRGRRDEPTAIRFDVISVWREGHETKIEHFENAF